MPLNKEAKQISVSIYLFICVCEFVLYFGLSYEHHFKFFISISKQLPFKGIRKNPCERKHKTEE